MSWISRRPLPRRLPWLLGISALIFLADRLSKNWIVVHIRYGGSIPVFGRVVRLSHWTNEGAAFSLFADAPSHQMVRWSLVAFTAAAAVGLAVALWILGRRFTLTTFALALILGGALGNLHDRIAYGSVIDFIGVNIFTYHYPDFNIADSAIVTGACLLLLGELMQQEKPAEQA